MTEKPKMDWADMADDDDLDDLPPPPGLPRETAPAPEKPAWGAAPQAQQQQQQQQQRPPPGMDRRPPPGMDRRPPPGMDRRPPPGMDRRAGGDRPREYEPAHDSRDAPREDRRDRPQRPIPDRPPFVVFVRNLSYDASERDVALGLFEGTDVVEVRLVLDRERQRSKGMAHVEFKTRADIETAVGFSGVEFMGRSVRIDVAEDRGNRRGDRSQPERGELDADWRSSAREVPRNAEPRRARQDRQDRAPRRPRNQQGEGDANGADPQQAPKERPKLVLQKRTVDTPLGQPAGGSPFGDARPRDEQQWQERRQQERREKKNKEAAAAAADPPAKQGDRARGNSTGPAGAKKPAKTAKPAKPAKADKKKADAPVASFNAFAMLEEDEA